MCAHDMRYLSHPKVADWCYDHAYDGHPAVIWARVETYPWTSATGVTSMIPTAIAKLLGYPLPPDVSTTDA